MPEFTCTPKKKIQSAAYHKNYYFSVACFARRISCCLCVCVCLITAIPPFTWQNEEFYFAKNSICRIQFQNASIFYLPFSFSKTQTQRRRRRQWRDDEKKILMKPTLDESENEKKLKRKLCDRHMADRRTRKKKVIYIPRAQREYHFCRSFAVRQQGQIVISSLFFFVIIFFFYFRRNQRETLETRQKKKTYLFFARWNFAWFSCGRERNEENKIDNNMYRKQFCRHRKPMNFLLLLAKRLSISQKWMMIFFSSLYFTALSERNLYVQSRVREKYIELQEYFFFPFLIGCVRERVVCMNWNVMRKKSAIRRRLTVGRKKKKEKRRRHTYRRCSDII